MKALSSAATSIFVAAVLFPPTVATLLAADARSAQGVGKSKRIKDMRKGIIELPVKKLFAQTRPNVAEAKRPKTTTGKFENPTVKPGDVRWHSDFSAAIAKAKRSRKPVLLFQLIGRLDQRFS